METTTDEIADRIFRFSTFVPDIGPTGFTFNQFLIDDDEPLLFHAGPRGMFPNVSEAIGRVTPLDQLRWVMFGHVESDECGAMNQFLAAAPRAQVAHGALGCLVSLNDLADRPPVPLEEGQVIELGNKRVQHFATPHVPHAWEAQVLYEQTTGVLFCGDLFSHLGNPAPLTSDDIIGAAAQAEDIFGATCLTPNTGPTIRKLGDLKPSVLAVMHGASFSGDGVAALGALADDYDRRLGAASSA